MLSAILFWVFAVGAVVSGLVMVTRKRPIHSAVAFLATLLSLAGLFLLLYAQFVAILQIIVYAGAILVLFLFVIMLLHAHSGEGPILKLQMQWPLALLLSLGLLAGLTYAFVGTSWPAAVSPSPQMGTAQSVGLSLFDRYMLPFEVASLLLLSGLLGAVVLSKHQSPSEMGKGPSAQAGEMKAENDSGTSSSLSQEPGEPPISEGAP